jgi:hypothetical protein
MSSGSAWDIYVRSIFKMLGCHEREMTQLRSQQARQSLLLQKDAPQRASTPSGESAGVLSVM